MDVGKPLYCILSFVFITKRILLFSLILVIFFKKCSSNEFDDTEINAEVSFRIGIDIHDTNGPIKNQQEVIVGHQKHQDGRKGKRISWVYLQVFLQ